MEIIFYVIFALLLIVVVVEFFMIKGFVRENSVSSEQRHLTGREIEEIRRQLATVGLQSIDVNDVLNIIMTIRDTHLGTYVDEDPYTPADPYDDIDGRKV